jgi:hypothetical protein
MLSSGPRAALRFPLWQEHRRRPAAMGASGTSWTRRADRPVCHSEGEPG